MMDPHPICVFFSAFSVAWVILTGSWFSSDPFLLLACSLSALSALYSLKFNAVTENAHESMETCLLRKKIQEINWRIMVRQAQYKSQIHAVLEENRRKHMKHRNHAPSRDTWPKSNMDGVRQWKSWTE